MEKMNIAYITSTGLRHNAFLDYLTKTFYPSLINREPKAKIECKVSPMTEKYRKEFSKTEKSFFKDISFNDSKYKIHYTKPGEINSDENIKIIRDSQPDILLLSFNLGFSWHEICLLARVAIFIKEFLANQEGIFYAMKNQS